VPAPGGLANQALEQHRRNHQSRSEHLPTLPTARMSERELDRRHQVHPSRDPRSTCHGRGGHQDLWKYRRGGICPAPISISFISLARNDFHGRLTGEFHQPSFARATWTISCAAQGISNTIGYLRRGGGDLGGRVIRNKLWFFGAYQLAEAQKNVAGLTAHFNPATGLAEGATPLPLERSWNYSYKLSDQASAKNKISFFGA